MAGPTRSRPGMHVWRYLGVLAAVVVLLYGTLLARDAAPRLGLDLQGGSTVTLTPRTEAGQAPEQEQLDEAVDIIRQRVNGLGVAESEVVTENETIVVSVPGVGRSALEGIGSTAQLRFREVLEVAPAQPLPDTASASASPTASASTSATIGESSASPAPAPSATASARGRALTRDLLAGAAPATPLSAAPSPSPTPARTPAAGTGDVQSGDPYTPEAFAALKCAANDLENTQGSDDRPEEEIVSCSVDGSTKYRLAKADVLGTDVTDASATLDPNLGTEWQVNLSFTGEGQTKWTALTERTVGKQVAIVLDGNTISAPRIQSRIDGDAQITGSFDEESARDLANKLKYGALPLTFERSQAETISPTLGTDQLRAGLLAGGLGLLLVVLYSLFYYRLLGIVTIASLLVSGLLIYASVSLLGDAIGFTLTLAGIAGLIVAVGITADSFVVFYERLKDEVREGRAPRAAVDRGWVRARRTILSADTVSFLAAVILYLVSIGQVRGFAFTLGLSTLIDVIVVFLFTRPMVSLMSKSSFFSSGRWTGFHGPKVHAGRPRPALAAAASKES